MLGVGTSIWNRSLAGKGDGSGGNPPAGITPIHSLNLTAAPSASNAFDGYGLATSRTVTDYNGRIVEIPANAVPMGGLRPVRNLWPTADGSDTPSTQVITVESGRVYQLRIGAESASGATAVCSGAFTGTLTGDGADIQAFDTGKTATTTSLTVTITGSIRKLQLQDITHRADLSTAPDEYVSTSDDYGTGVNGFRYFDTELANTVASNVVTEITGDPVEGWGDWQPTATNLDPRSTPKTAYYTKTDLSITDDSDTGPFGDGSAALITGTGGSDGTAYQASTVNYVSGTQYCFWQIAKAGTGSWHRIVLPYSAFGTGNDRTAWFNVSTGALGASQAQIESYGIRRLADSSYYVCWISATCSNSATRSPGYIAVADADESTTSTGTIYVAHTQCETGAVPTAYIPTSGSPETRPAMNPAPTISGLAGTEDARLVVKGLASDLVTPDPTDDTERTLDVDNTDGEFDTVPLPIKVLSIDVYNDGERPA